MNLIGTNNINAGNLIFASGSNSSIIIGSLPINMENLFGWYSSDYGVYNAPGVLASEGQTVRIWENKINNGVDLNHNNLQYQPIYISGAIQFNNNVMSGIAPTALNSPLTYYIVTQTILSGGGGTTPGYIIKNDPSISNFRYAFGITTGSEPVVRASNATTTLPNLKMNIGANILYASFSGLLLQENKIKVGKNNISEIISTQVFGSNNNNIFIIGSTSAPIPLNNLKGSIYEILIYTGIQTDVEQNKIIDYLKIKWGVIFDV